MINNNVLVLLLSVGLILGNSCKKPEKACMDSNASNYHSTAEENCCCTYEVTFEVSGTAGLYFVVYTPDNDYPEIEVDSVANWSSTRDVVNSYEYVDLKAYNLADSGSTTVTIWKGDEIIKTSTINWPNTFASVWANI